MIVRKWVKKKDWRKGLRELEKRSRMGREREFRRDEFGETDAGEE